MRFQVFSLQGLVGASGLTVLLLLLAELPHETGHWKWADGAFGLEQSQVTSRNANDSVPDANRIAGMIATVLQALGVDKNGTSLHGFQASSNDLFGGSGAAGSLPSPVVNGTNSDAESVTPRPLEKQILNADRDDVAATPAHSVSPSADLTSSRGAFSLRQDFSSAPPPRCEPELRDFEPPFRLISVYPLSAKSRFVLKGMQPLLAAFSIPVVPVGGPPLSYSDAPEKAAFSVQANNSLGTVSGRGYWLTPKIYRFQPFEPWPTDLRIEVHLNGNLRSLSGSAVDTADPYWICNKVRVFTTPRLVARVRAVTSKLASSFTDGRWSPTLSQSADPLSSHLEVPPDGEVVITFNSAVDIGNLNDERLHARLIAVAHYRPGGGTKEDEYYYVDYDARKCLDAEVDSLVSKGPDVSPFTAGDQDRQRDEVVGCAVLSFTRDQLRSGQEYELLIKKKIRYNKMSGPTGQRKPVESPSPHVTADRTEYLQAATLASSSTSVFSRFLLSVGEVPNDEDPDSQESTEENLEEEDSDGDDRYHGPDGGEDGGADQAVSSNRPESSGFVYSETTLNLRQFEKLGGGSVGLQLTGLRPFKFFGTGNSSFRSMPTVRYRRLTLLLPHGLNGCQPKKHLWPRTCWSSWTSVDARSAKAVERLAGQIDLRVEGSNQTVNFTLHLRDSITAVLTSRDLRPGVNYVLSVGGSVMVRDKFNQPLQPSVLAFRMDRLQNSARLVLPRDPRVWLIEDSYLRHQLQERATVHLGTAVQFTGSGRSTGVSSSNEDMEVRQVISNDFGECLRSRPEACLATLFDNFTTARENYHGRSVKEVTPSQTFPHPNLVYSFKNGASSMSGSFKAATPQPFLFHGFTTTSLFLITVKSKDPVQLYTSTSHFLWGVSRFLVRVAPTVRHEAEKAPALLVQALDLETAYPLTRSMISVYGKPRGGSVVLLGDGMTDVRGFALVPVENPAATMKLILVVVPAGQVAPYVSEIFDVPSVWFAPNTAGSAARPSWDVPRSRLRLRNGEIIYRKDLSFVLLSDRSTYRPGESILLSGFQFLRVESWDSGSRATTLIHDAFGLDPGDLKIWLQVTWQTPEGRGGTPNGVPPRGSSRDNPIEERASADRVMRDSRGAVSSTNRGSAGDAEECSNVVVTLDEFGSFVATVNVPTKAEHGLRAVIDVGIFERGGLPEENAIMAGACMLHPESLVQTENIVQPTVLSRPNIVIFAPRRTAVFLTEVNVPPFVRHDGQLLVKGVVKTHDGLHLNGQQVRLRFIFDVPAFLLTRFGRNSGWWAVKTRQRHAAVSVVSRRAGRVRVEAAAWSNGMGSFEFSLNLGELVWMAEDRKASPLRLQLGTAISVEVECQRPKTERGTPYKETTIVANTPWSISAFEVSITPLLPGVPFTVTTRVVPRPRVKSVEQIGREVVLEVLRVAPETPLPLPHGIAWKDWMKNPGLARCPLGYMPLATDGTVEVKELRKLEGITLVQRCDAKRDCYVKLPVDAAQYLFIATLTDTAMGRETRCEFFQANQRTLSSQQISLKVRLHKHKYAAGDGVRLRFLNPFAEGSAIRPLRTRTMTGTANDNAEKAAAEADVEVNVSVVWNTQTLRRHSRMVSFRNKDIVDISVGRVPEECLSICSFTLFITLPMSSEPLPLMQLDLSENGLYPSTAVAQNPLALKYGPFVVQQEIKVVVSHPVRELHVPAGAVDLRIIDSRGLPRKTFDGKERVTVQVTVHKSRLGLDGLLKVRGWQRNVTSSSDQRDGTSVQSARPISASSFSTPTSASAFLTFPSVPSNTSVNPSDSEETGDGSMFLDDLPLSVKGQVLLTMVDKRFLDSASAPVFPLADQLDKRAAAGPHHGVGTTVLKWSSSLDQVCSYEGFRFINEVKQRRLATDPWFDDLPWPLLPRMFYNSTYSNEYLDDTAVYEKYAWPLTGQFPPKHASSLKKVRVSQRGLFMAEWGQVLRPDPAEAAGNDGVWDVTPKASGEPPNGEEQEDLDILEDVRPFHGEDHDADYELQFLPRTQPIIGWRAVELVDIGRGILRGSLEVTLPNEATAHAVRAYTVIRVSPAQTSSSTETIPGRVSDESPSETHSAFAATDTSRRGILVQDQQSFEAETMARERYSGTALMVDSLEKVFQIRKSVAVRAYAPSTIRREDVALVGVTLDAGPNLIGKGAIVKLVSTSLLTPLTSLTPRTQRVYIERPTQQVLFHVAADRGFGTAEAIFSVGLGASTSRLSSQRESLSDWFTFPSLPSMGTTFEASMARSSLNDNGAWSKRRFRRVVTVKVTMEVLPSLRRMTTANLYPVEALNISLDDPAVEALGYNTRIGLPLPRPVVPDIGTLRLAAGISGVSAILFRLRELIQTRLFVPYENRSMDWFQRPYNGSDLLIILFGEALMRKAYGFQDAQVAVAADRARTLLPGFYSGDSSRGFLAAPAKTVKGANAPLSVMLTMLAVFVADAGVTSSLKFQRRKFVVAANRYIRMMASTWNQNNEGMTLLQYIGPALIGTLRFVLGSSHRFGLDLQSEHALSTTSLLPQTQTTREDICDKLPPHILWALLVMKRENPTAETHPVESSCIRAMIRLFRRRGLKGYIALGVDTDEPNTNTVHSLMLLLLTSRPQWTQEYAEEIRAMMIYLYGGGRKPPRAFMVPGLSRWSLVLLLLAIEQWDRQLRNVTDQNLVLEVQARESSEIDGYPLIDGRFYSHHRGPVERSIGWRELEKKVASRRNEKLRRLFADEVPVAKAGLAVLAVGKGTAIVSTLSDFMPSRPVVQPTYEGCLVQKRYHLLDAHRGYCKPDSTLVVNSGDRVCVFITVTFKSTAKLITVRDWLPAGLQPLDEVAEGFSPQSLTPIPRDQAADCAVTTPFLEGHCKKYIRGQAIEWVCESLPPGTHSFAVLASANFPGFYEVSLSTAFVYVLARRSVPGDQAGSTSFSRTLQGTSGAAHKAFAVLPINHGTEDVLTMKQIDPFTIAGLPTPPLWFLEGRPKICPTCELGTVCSPALGECVSEGF
uniref:Bacterial alpha-2-macroglobulin MG10 domain-containing protein n=1 Tax=Neospora caninum (strain Liverpool) TaxID=572307 RepID=A0A0F7UEG7_NEOCL|nr:TPA: hypothetical protein BN1204_040650 [Neospora caninum Liverpool]